MFIFEASIDKTMKKILSIALVVLMAFGRVKADEGMWIPSLIAQNYEAMKKLGLELSPEQIYDINNSSLKDAIVRLGRGFCTGEIISNKGLMLTNHHCGYSVIQEKSSPENDYLTDGFWAMNTSEELPAGFSVSFLQKVTDLTDLVLKNVTNDMTEEDRAMKIAENQKKIQEDADLSKYQSLDIKSMFSGNKYFGFQYISFPDVRLVGAPPSSIGKFGGDTDNWMWTRHTGDFSMFRVYADKDNQPAEYSKDNLPYQPKHHLPVSLKGVEQGDFAMIFGFPGSTDRFLTSYGVKFQTEKDQPARVKIRRTKLDIYEKYMNQSDAVRIQYAAKHAQVSNYWKYFIGQTQGLKRLKVYEKKKAEENAFEKWMAEKDERKEAYATVIPLYEDVYKTYNQSKLAETYFFEAIAGIEMMRHGFMLGGIGATLSKLSKAKGEEKTKLETQLNGMIGATQNRLDGLFKDYNAQIDREVFGAMLAIYVKNIPAEQRPARFNALYNKLGNAKMTAKVFDKSILVSKEKLSSFLKSPSEKKLKKDLGFKLAQIFYGYYLTELDAMFGEADVMKNKADRLYKKAMLEMNPNKHFYPNANSSMRYTYGQVLEYEPKDAVKFYHYTTLEGVFQKEDPSSHEFQVPTKLKELYFDQDYGQYANKDGQLPLCFLSNNDITGGNSGSPVINSKGELIGTAFDGNWEAMSGDIAFEPKLQRTISVDIRYTLFIIDKFAGASHLIDEMTLVK